MLVRIRDSKGGGFTVTLYDADGDKDSRHTADLKQAFAWQKAGGFSPQHEPETKKGKAK